MSITTCMTIAILSCLQVHGSLEIFALLIIAFELGMKVKWLGIKMFVCHIRTVIKVLAHNFVAQYKDFRKS